MSQGFSVRDMAGLPPTTIKAHERAEAKVLAALQKGPQLIRVDDLYWRADEKKKGE